MADKVEVVRVQENFVYYQLELKLLREMLGTCCEPTIYSSYVLKQAKLAIKQANNLSGKITKALEKFRGSDITVDKETAELQAIIRRYQELLGRKDDVPADIDGILEYAKELEADFDERVKSGESMKATFFMRDKNGKPMVSCHMIIGNLKENLRIITNNTTLSKDQRAAPSKVSVGEMLALDVKPVEEFMIPSNDIERKEDGSPKILIRPIKFERMGKVETALAASETLPVGTEMSCHLRVRMDSPILEILEKLLDLGKSNGLGAWRGSGSKGQYCFKLTKIEHNPTQIPNGWR